MDQVPAIWLDSHIKGQAVGIGGDGVDFIIVGSIIEEVVIGRPRTYGALIGQCVIESLQIRVTEPTPFLHRAVVEGNLIDQLNVTDVSPAPPAAPIVAHNWIGAIAVNGVPAPLPPYVISFGGN